MQSFNPYLKKNMHFKISFLSSFHLFSEALPSDKPMSQGLYSFWKYFFTYFQKSLYQFCDSYSIWAIDSILPRILWFIFLNLFYLFIMYQVFLAGNTISATLILMEFSSCCQRNHQPFLFSSFSSNWFILWIEWISCFFWWYYNNTSPLFCQHISLFFIKLIIFIFRNYVYTVICLNIIYFSDNLNYKFFLSLPPADVAHMNGTFLKNLGILDPKKPENRNQYAYCFPASSNQVPWYSGCTAPCFICAVPGIVCVLPRKGFVPHCQW